MFVDRQGLKMNKDSKYESVTELILQKDEAIFQFMHMEKMSCLPRDYQDSTGKVNTILVLQLDKSLLR